MKTLCNALKGATSVCTACLLFVAVICSCGNDDDVPPAVEEGGVEDSPVEAVLDSAEFCCKRDGLNIYGLMYSRVSPGEKAPAVILSHSSSLTHAAMRDYARQIADRGMVAYCFDFCGGSSDSKSDGSTDDMTVFTEVDDLKAVLAAVRALDSVDADSVYLLGSSQGGLVSALVAEECASDVCGLILFYPAFNIPDLISKYGNMMGQMGDNEFISSLRGYDVWSHIGSYGKPVTIIHGSADMIVPVSYSEKAAELYPDARLYIIDGANHGFNAANLGSMGSMMGGGVNYDAEVMPIVYSALHR